MALNKFFRKDAGRQLVDFAGETDLLLVLNKLAHSVDYVKTTAGAPTGSGIEGEKVLNTVEFKVYTRSAGTWGSGAGLTTGDRAIHKDAGSDSSGLNGASAASNRIYAYSGGVMNEIIATKGMRALVEDESNAFYQFITSWTQETVPDFVNANRTRVPVLLRYAYRDGFAANQTNVAIFEAAGNLQQIIMPAAGSVVKTTLQATAPRTAGTLTMRPSKNGVAFISSALNRVLDLTNATSNYGEVAAGSADLIFAAGDNLGCLFTSDASWAPQTSTIEGGLFVVFNT